MTLKEYSVLAEQLKINNCKLIQTKLYNEYYNRTFLFVKKRFKNIPINYIEDLATESILHSFDRIELYDINKSSYYTWLQTIMFNKCLKHIKIYPVHNEEILIIDENFDLIGLNRSISGNKYKTILKNLFLYDNDKHVLDNNDNPSEEEYIKIKEKYSDIENILQSLEKEDLKNIAINYYIDGFSYKDLLSKFNILEHTLKNKLRKIKIDTIKKYSNLYPHDNINTNNIIRLNRESKKRKDLKNKRKNLLKSLNITKEKVNSLKTETIYKKIYIDYRINNLKRLDVKNKFKLKNIDYINDYCYRIENLLIEKYNTL